LPTQQIPTVLVAIKNKKMSASKMEEKLRKLEVPVIARVDKDEILLDLRTGEPKMILSHASSLKAVEGTAG
jgi:L-seryl-tRNA(Ser) seleniumtransferase